MKKIISFVIVAIMLISVMCLAGCNKQGGNDTVTTTVTDTNKTTVHVEGSQTAPQQAAMFEFSKYGYHIYYPQGFEILNNEGNMVEFMNKEGVDFTVLVLENRYESLSDMIDAQLEEEEEVVKQGSNYFLVYSAGNGRTNYIYYYYGEDMVRCELSYTDAQKEAMKGLENKIMVEPHSH